MDPQVSVIPMKDATQQYVQVVSPQQPRQSLLGKLKDFLLRRKQTPTAQAYDGTSVSVAPPPSFGNTIDFKTANQHYNQQVQVGQPKESPITNVNGKPTVSLSKLRTSVAGIQPSQYPSPLPGRLPTPTASPTNTGKISLNSFLGAISGQESGGSYDVRNKDTGAIGKYQILPSNWSAWAKEAGLPANAPTTPANQEKVAQHKIQQYYNKYGNWEDVASAWYSGRPLSKVAADAKQGDYPTIRSYVNSVIGRAGGG